MEEPTESPANFEKRLAEVRVFTAEFSQYLDTLKAWIKSEQGLLGIENSPEISKTALSKLQERYDTAERELDELEMDPANKRKFVTTKEAKDQIRLCIIENSEHFLNPPEEPSAE